MAAFVIRPKLTKEEADILINTAQQFFKDNPRRRVFRVGDGDRPWFNVRKLHILLDVSVHTQNTGCPKCGSTRVQATKEGLLFCWDCEFAKYLLKNKVTL
ncbi:MAG: hypothetical protein KGL39_59500 [Patescibacteria group bacterium]|nr:hypothetical protein [Patescibacteria group bacterium]